MNQKNIAERTFFGTMVCEASSKGHYSYVLQASKRERACEGLALGIARC